MMVEPPPSTPMRGVKALNWVANRRPLPAVLKGKAGAKEDRRLPVQIRFQQIVNEGNR